MGLDSVEFIMQIEKTFDIQIPDSVAEQTDTVGKLYDVVWQTIDKKQQGRCSSQTLFYRLRRHLGKKAGTAAAIHPGTLLQDLIPYPGRRTTWKELAKALNIKLPPLRFPATLATILLTLALGILGAGILLSWQVQNEYHTGRLIYVAGFLLSIGIIYLCYLLLNPLRTSLPVGTIRALTYKILELNFAQLNEQGTSRKEVEQIVNSVIVDRLAIEPKDISPEKSFVFDFGIDR